MNSSTNPSLMPPDRRARGELWSSRTILGPNLARTTTQETHPGLSPTKPASWRTTRHLIVQPRCPPQIGYLSGGTPLTNQHYIASPRGEFYGLDHSMARLQAEAIASVRAQTAVPNLYLTGTARCRLLRRGHPGGGGMWVERLSYTTTNKRPSCCPAVG